MKSAQPSGDERYEIIQILEEYRRPASHAAEFANNALGSIGHLDPSKISVYARL